MQNKLSDINKKVAEKHGLDEELLNSISTSVFREFSYKLNNPTNLIVYIKGLGKFYARKKKTEDGIRRTQYVIDNPKGFNNPDTLKHNLQSMKFLVSKYEEFYQHRNQFRDVNNNNTND